MSVLPPLLARLRLQLLNPAPTTFELIIPDLALSWTSSLPLVPAPRPCADTSLVRKRVSNVFGEIWMVALFYLDLPRQEQAGITKRHVSAISMSSGGVDPPSPQGPENMTWYKFEAICCVSRGLQPSSAKSNRGQSIQYMQRAFSVPRFMYFYGFPTMPLMLEYVRVQNEPNLGRGHNNMRNQKMKYSIVTKTNELGIYRTSNSPAAKKILVTEHVLRWTSAF
ncbi:hypothetical protein C8R43DRAFT_956745 [Mycena crocata]|nr:hypothetical protein C8R43DRAFT_956745 [Mycena crocata]